MIKYDPLWRTLKEKGISQHLAGTQDVSEFACAIQRSRAKDNVIMERILSRNILSFSVLNS